MTASTPETSPYMERIGKATFVGRNERGAEVRIGLAGAADSFTPGELLQLALGACGVLSADHVLSSRLGEDFASLTVFEAATTEEGDRYERIGVSIRANMAALSEDRGASLTERSERAISRLCAIGRTLSHGVDYRMRVEHDPDLPASAE